MERNHGRRDQACICIALHQSGVTKPSMPRTRPSPSISVATSGPASAQTECVTTKALRVRDNFQGWGNRVGWWLTASALAKALDRPAVYTGWHGAPKWQGGRNYDYAEVRRVVQFPAVLRFIEDSSGAAGSVAGLPRLKWEELFGALDAEEIPYHPKPYVNDYVPETAWQMVRDWGPRRLFRWSRCIDRARFLSEYRAVQQQLRPRIQLCNPRRRSYLAVHVRGADNGRDGTGSRPAAAAAGERAEDVPSNATLHALASIGAASGKPWLVLSDSEATRTAVEQRLRTHSQAIAERPCVLPPHPDANASASAMQTLAVLQDFFALVDSAGCVAVAGHGKGRSKVGRSFRLGESSFVTVAALAGDVPLLTPVPFALAGTMARYELLGNGGKPMRGVFYLEDLATFIRALGNSAVRYRDGTDTTSPARAAPP